MGKPHPYKGIPRKDWPKKGLPNDVFVKQSGHEDMLNVRRGTLPGASNQAPSVLPGMPSQVHEGVAKDPSADRIAAVEKELSILRERVSAPGGIESSAMQNVRESGGTEASSGLHEAVRGGVDVSKMPLNTSSDLAPAAPPVNLFSGDMLQLQVFGKDGTPTDPLPGYRLYWFNDYQSSGVRISMARRSGWEFVEKQEVALNEGLTPGNSDLGAHVRKVVGHDGSNPLYAYLMKKPLWLVQQHADEHEQKTNARIEDSLRRGYPDANAPGPAQSVKIEIGSKLYR